MRRSPQELFWSHVEKLGGESSCWIWKASCNSLGYGFSHFGDKTQKAHRVAWQLTQGPIPDGLCVLHRCDNPPCVNPAHLFLGTLSENNRDMATKGRARNGSRTHPERRPRGDGHYSRQRPELLARGERNGSAKLTAADVIAIRLAGGTQQQIADRFGVCRSAISHIRSGRVWVHIKQNER